MKPSRTWVLGVVLSFMVGSLAWAQKGGKITGTVTDAETGKPLFGANVVLEDTRLGAATDENGRFFILRVPPGKYSVRADYMGFQRQVLQNVEVSTDLTTEAGFRLVPAPLDLGQTVVVIAEKPMVTKDLTSHESRVQAEEIQKLPVKELDHVLDLQAGIVRDAGGGIHMRGGRSTEILYMINGISIVDDYSRGRVVQIENESVQELQVISGTFNAEYGNAMSGVVNVVTKTGGNRFHGHIDLRSGDYASSSKSVFWNIDDGNPFANRDVQGSVSGPVIRDHLTFFLTGRWYANDGWIYGPLAFSPQGRRQMIDGTPTRVLGDSSAVPMNFSNRVSGQVSFEWRLANPLTLRFDVIGSDEERKTYRHAFRLNPLGYPTENEGGWVAIAGLTHLLGKRTFHELTVAYKTNEIGSRLYENPFDTRYVHPDSLNTGAYQFVKAGTDLTRFRRTTASWIGKWELTSQINRRHQAKMGIEVQTDDIFFDDATLVPATDTSGQQIVPFRPGIPDPSEPMHSRFRRNPLQFAVFAQDKIEYDSFIINIGLRFDWFDPKGKVPVDSEDPNIYNPFKLDHIYRDSNSDGVIGLDEQTSSNRLTMEEREALWYRNTTPKTQVSPRLGVAYPITDHGVIHFSYGIFQQIPDYSQLYFGDLLKVTAASEIQGPFGFPDLKPQQSTMYELGLQQQVSRNIAVDVTGYYRDIRNWISTSPPIPTALAGAYYIRKNNRDFANVAGITFSMVRRLADGFSFNVDYTFQVAEGTNSTPEEEYFAQKYGNTEPTRQLTPLNWDQRHALNASLFLGSKNWGASLVSRFQSGQPYTPVLVTSGRVGRNIVQGLEDNSRLKPNRFELDFHAFHSMNAGPFSVQWFVQILNVLDAGNPVDVFGDTGEADFSLFSGHAVQADPSWFVRPDFYSEPRQVQVGAKLFF